MANDLEFGEDPQASKLPEHPTPKAAAEAGQVEAPIKANTFVFRFGIGHLSFEADSPVQIFALISLIILSIVAVCVAGFGALAPSGATWPEKAFTVLGAAITTVVGAIVGAAAASSRPRRK